MGSNFVHAMTIIINNGAEDPLLMPPGTKFAYSYCQTPCPNRLQRGRLFLSLAQPFLPIKVIHLFDFCISAGQATAKQCTVEWHAVDSKVYQ